MKHVFRSCTLKWFVSDAQGMNNKRNHFKASKVLKVLYNKHASFSSTNNLLIVILWTYNKGNQSDWILGIL